MNGSRIFKSALVGTVAALALAGSAFGQARSFDVPAGDLKAALDAYVRQAGVQLIYRSDDVRGKSTRGVHGALAPEAALEQLLAGSGVVATRDRSGAIVVAKPPQAAAGASPASEAAQSEESTQLGEIVVTTGSRIRGAPSSSPVTRLTQEEMRNAGNANLGDAIRQLPQNFNGGQNPSIGTSVGTENGNANSTSQLNLRGLGPDATLTLLNGRRLAYTGVRQGVDLTAIPLEAVDRVEIVSDGASALYGSDAIAGVANIILRRDYDGLSANARFGAATEGAYEQEQYTLAGGRTWTGGSIVGTLNYENSTAISAGQRSYTQLMQRSAIIYPRITAWGGLISANQSLSSAVSLNLDAMYNRRDSFTASPNTLTAAYSVAGRGSNIALKSYLLAPNIDIKLPGDWRANLNFTYGHDETVNDTDNYAGGIITYRIGSVVTNRSRVFEATAEGPVLSLPAGSVRLAVGGGVRKIGLDNFRSAVLTTPQSFFSANQDAKYGYAELFLPLANRERGPLKMGDLSLTAAARYEDYGRLGDVLVPKLGMSYAPSPDVDFKASWGKSFKAPVLNRLYSVETITLVTAASAGGVGYPASATVLLSQGGNADLAPERATSWQLTASIHPRFLPNSNITVSYFNTDYTDRVVQAMPSYTSSLSNPLYAMFVTRNPSAARQAELLSRGGGTLLSFVTGPYVPANVIAAVDNRPVNAARQRLEGMDFTANQKFDVGDLGDLSANLAATYLVSNQVLIPGAPSSDLSGTIFNPPKLRASLGVVWSLGEFVFSPRLSYSGRLEDRRLATPIKVSSQTTYDLTARYRLRGRLPGLNDVEIAASVLNLTDKAPPALRTTSLFDLPYESTNYNPIGRFISLSLTGRW